MKLKYLISITLALVLTVVLSACGQNSDDSQHHNAKYAPKMPHRFRKFKFSNQMIR